MARDKYSSVFSSSGQARCSAMWLHMLILSHFQVPRMSHLAALAHCRFTFDKMQWHRGGGARISFPEDAVQPPSEASFSR